MPGKPFVSVRTLLLAGALLLVGGFVYDLVFAGIPYQDPTPAMTARYEFHARIASVMRWAGFAGICLGGIAAVRTRRRQRQSPEAR